MNKSNRTQNDLLFLSISFFIVVVAWIGFNLYHNYVTSTINPDLQMQVIPINPNFDHATIEKLKTRAQVTPAYELSGSGGTSTPTSVQTPSISPSPTASASSTITPTIQPTLTGTP